LLGGGLHCSGVNNKKELTEKGRDSPQCVKRPLPGAFTMGKNRGNVGGTKFSCRTGKGELKGTRVGGAPRMWEGRPSKDMVWGVEKKGTLKEKTSGLPAQTRSRD